MSEYKNKKQAKFWGFYGKKVREYKNFLGKNFFAFNFLMLVLEGSKTQYYEGATAKGGGHRTELTWMDKNSTQIECISTFFRLWYV